MSKWFGNKSNANVNYNSEYDMKSNVNMNVDPNIEYDEDGNPLPSAANANGKPLQRLVVNAIGQLDQSLLRITEGFLYKKGGANHGNGIRRNWKRRHFVLGEYDTEFGVGYELRYYDGIGGNLKGTIDLNGCEVFCEARSMHKQVKYEFQILLASGNVQQLSSDNYEEREDWIETLNMVIAYMKKMWGAGSGGGPLGFNLDGYDPLLEDDEDIWDIGAELAQQVHVFGDGVYGSEAGGYGQFVIQLFDLNGERVTRGGAPLTVTISNSECLYYLKIHDNGDGSYFVHYMLYKPDVYQLHIKLNDEHEVKGSPFELTVMPSKTVPEKCVGYGDCLSTMVMGSTYTFTIQARDIFGNNKSRGGDPFELGVMGAAQLRSIDDNGDGSYTCTLDCQSPTEESNSYYAAATLLILVTLHGKHIQGSPFNVNLIDNGDNGSVSGPGAGSPAAVTNLPTSLGRKDRSPPPRPSSSIAGEESVSASVSSPRPPSPPAGYQTVSSTDSSPQQPPPPPPPATVTVPGVRLSASVSQRLPPSKPSRAAPVTPAAVAPVAPPQASPPPPIQQQQTLAPALDIPPEQYAAMSRLEKARYNAMRAAQSKQQQQQGQGLSQNQIYGDNSSISSSTNTVKLQRLQRHTQELTQPAPVATHPRTGTGTGGSKLSNMIRQQKNLNQSQQQAQQGAGTDMALVLQGLQAGLHGSYSATSTDVATPPNTKPAVSKSDEQKLWSLCNSALRTSKELHALLAHTYTSVREAFGDYCDHKVAPVPVLRLAEAEGARGAYKLFEDFGVTPTYLSRKELRVIFTLALASQKNHRASALTQYMQSSTGVQDSMGGLLDWTHYLVLLVLVSSYSLSKTNAFNSLYPTVEAKLNVLLMKCGLGDVNKVNMIREFSSRS